MLKNWKSLFVKTDEQENLSPGKADDSYSFPLQPAKQEYMPALTMPKPVEATVNDSVNEVLEVYENGLDSINMPGYDFYEFYKSISSTGSNNVQTYNMAFQMAKTLDKTITAQKLLTDAEFYISKINEVHNQYVMQGQQKLNSIQEKKSAEKSSLNSEIEQGSMRLAQLRAELHELETSINNKRSTLAKIEEQYQPQEKLIREKMNANDTARSISIQKLNNIKQGIQQFIKL